MCDDVSATERTTSWCKTDELPWLTRYHPADTLPSDGHHTDGPSSSPASRLPWTWVDPDMVVPPPGRTADVDHQRPRRTAAAASSGLHLKDKFDELDEETMSPLSWRSQPATVMSSWSNDIPPPTFIHLLITKGPTGHALTVLYKTQKYNKIHWHTMTHKKSVRPK